MVNNQVLIRLMDWENDNMIRAFYTEKPENFLAMYDYCDKHDMPIYIPQNLNKEDDPYNNVECGFIEEIHIGFGGNESIPNIDIWVKV